jgi:L-asparaginase II
MTANPVLVKMTRNGLVESIHRGSACVVDRTGNILWMTGNIRGPVFTRSAMKFIQVLPLIESGAADHFQLTDEEIAVICASHNGEPEHLRVVIGILNRAEISPDALRCGAHRPFHGPASDQLLTAGLKPTALHNNCSGKHAGFLLLSKFLNAPLESYLDPEHPVQQMVKEAAADLYEVPASELFPGTDGCSAPNFALPLFNHAIGFRNLTMSRPGNPVREAACARVVRAVSTHPFMVAGTGRYCTDLMRESNGSVIGKVGAEGVYGMALVKEQIGIAIKIDDGTMGPQYQVAQALLEDLLGVIVPALEKYRKQPIYNFMKKLTGSKEDCLEINKSETK